MTTMTSELRCLLIVEAERARIAIDARTAAVSRWDREEGVLRTLVNVGALAEGEVRFPTDEVYQLDAFPAVAALLEHGRAYLNPEDVSSASIAAYGRHGSHVGVPIVVRGQRWGELWAARHERADRLTRVDLERMELVAGRIGDGLAALRG